jgi:tetratricopeptide (TPR) repeat protein
MFCKKPNSKKAAKHEAKGDRLLAKGKLGKALKQYRKALEFDPERTTIYDKLIQTRDGIDGEWNVDDFSESMSWVMDKQEIDNPNIRQVHARLSPEWEVASNLAMVAIIEEDEQLRGEKIEKLVSMGEISTRVLIDMMIEMKNSSEKHLEDNEGPNPGMDN